MVWSEAFSGARRRKANTYAPSNARPGLLPGDDLGSGSGCRPTLPPIIPIRLSIKAQQERLDTMYRSNTLKYDPSISRIVTLRVEVKDNPGMRVLDLFRLFIRIRQNITQGSPKKDTIYVTHDTSLRAV